VLEPPYVPPLPPQPGPKPPTVVDIEERTASSIRIAWGDLSDNETGNRIMRTTDVSSWEILDEVGSIAKFETFTYLDTNLQPDTRYCYKIETWNTEGARQSPQFGCTYTHDGNDIRVWRLQLRVRVANISNAGTDNTLRVIVAAGNNQYLPTHTFLDYGQNDFERGSIFTYDLNLDNIHEPSDITDLRIINYGDAHASSDFTVF